MNVPVEVTFTPCADCATVVGCGVAGVCRVTVAAGEPCAAAGCGERPANYWHTHAREFYCRSHADEFNERAGRQVCRVAYELPPAKPAAAPVESSSDFTYRATREKINAETTGWIRAIGAAQGAVEGMSHRSRDAETVLEAIYKAAVAHGLNLRRPAYLASPDPRQTSLQIPD